MNILDGAGPPPGHTCATCGKVVKRVHFRWICHCHPIFPNTAEPDLEWCFKRADSSQRDKTKKERDRLGPFLNKAFRPRADRAVNDVDNVSASSWAPRAGWIPRAATQRSAERGSRPRHRNAYRGPTLTRSAARGEPAGSRWSSARARSSSWSPRGPVPKNQSLSSQSPTRAKTRHHKDTHPAHKHRHDAEERGLVDRPRPACHKP